MNSNVNVLERQFRFRKDSIKLYSNKIYIFKNYLECYQEVN